MIQKLVVDSMPQSIKVRYVYYPRTNEPLEVRQLEDGSYVCPVCGTAQGGEAPWEDTTSETCKQPIATGSHQICIECNTQYGFDDVPLACSDLGVNDMWRMLRMAWLDRIEWNERALDRLRKNLGIDLIDLKRQTGRA